MCNRLDSRDKAYMISELANSVKCLGARPEKNSSVQNGKYDETVRRLLDKINKLVEEV